jgi:ribose transport system ATP-binding protein
MHAVALALEAIDLVKEYPGVRALRGVSLGLRPGEVHALIGKNGAGKSSLVKIFSGAMQPTSGTLRVGGEAVTFRSPQDAIGHGIATVHQELSMVPELSVAENIALGRLPGRVGRFGVNWRAMRETARGLLADLGLTLDVEQPVSRLSVAQQQLVEIARAMSSAPRVLMLDEPTSALTGEEAERLFALIRRLKQRQVAIVYISHRLQELRQIVDVISVLRDGELVGTLPGATAQPQEIAQMMFGETVLSHRPADLPVSREVLLEVRGLTRAPRVNDVSFKLHRGEILGLAGMLGAGRSELVRLITGADSATEGEILIEGRALPRPTPRSTKRAGIGMTPEHRKADGFVPQMNIAENLCLAPLARICRAGVLSPGLQRTMVRDSIRDLSIKVADTRALMSTLSGGNQQKVVVGNWLNTQPRIMIYDEPTRGIDIQAKQHIFQIIWEQSRRGLGSIFISSELEELLEVCHRLLVMIEGRIVAEVSTDGLSLERLLQLCTGD